jgi:predicted ATPase
MAAHLDDRPRLLTMRRRTALPRHQITRATLDGSYEVLPEVERHRMAYRSRFLQYRCGWRCH